MRCILTLLMLLLAGQAYASCNANGCDGKPKDIYSNMYMTGWNDGRVFLQVTQDKEKLDCQLAEGHYMTLAKSHPLFDQIYSALLGASIADKRIYIRIKNDSSICEISYVRIYN